MERAMGIEPTLSAWKAEVLPLNYARMPHVAAAMHAGHAVSMALRCTLEV